MLPLPKNPFSGELCNSPFGRSKTGSRLREVKGYGALVLSLILSVAQVMGVSEVQAEPGGIRCDNLLDVRAGRLIEDQVIAWDKDGVIIYAGPASLSPDGITPIDLSGLTCLVSLTSIPISRGTRKIRGTKVWVFQFRARL